MDNLTEFWICMTLAFLIPVGAVRDRIYAPNSMSCRVPAMYIFGDSTADAGINNARFTIARSNYPPYGRDFETRHATGRFCNGKMVHDWIAEFLHLAKVPHYLGPEATMFWNLGANFASAGAGIFNSTGNVVGMKVSGWQQIELFLQEKNLLVERLGETKATNFVKNSVFFIANGANDFIHNWILHDADSVRLPLDAFQRALVLEFERQLKVPTQLVVRSCLATSVGPSTDIIEKPAWLCQTLYNAGARKLAVVGVGPVGCAPHFLWLNLSRTGECVEPVNQYIFQFNENVRSMVVRFNTENDGAHAIYRDTFDIVYLMSTFPFQFGFVVGNTACCGQGLYGGGDTCERPNLVCAHPNLYVWWDEYHTTHKANYFISKEVFSGREPSNSSSNATYLFPTLEDIAALDLSGSCPPGP